MRFIICTLLLISTLTCLAQNQLDSLEKALPTANGKARLTILNELGFSYSYSSLEKARQYSYLGLKEAKDEQDKTYEVEALINVAYSNYDYNQIDSARYYFMEARTLAESTNFKKGLANSNNGLGSVYKRMGNYPQAIAHYKEALIAQEELENHAGISGALQNIGRAMYDIGNNNQAIEYYLKALAINREQELWEKAALNLSNIALVHINQSEEHLALPYLKEIQTLPNISIKAKGGLYNDLALVAKKEKDYNLALDYFNTSISYFDSLGASTAIVRHNLADTYLDQQEYKKALAMATEALDAKRKSGNTSSVIYTLNLLSEIYLKTNQNEKARMMAEEALTLSKSIGSDDRRRQSLKYLSEAVSALGDYKQAWQIRLHYEQLKDSLFNQQKVQQQAAMLAIYETEKQQKTIALQKANLEVQEASLALSNARNNTLTLIIVAAGVLTLLLTYGFYNKYKSNQLLALQRNQLEASDQEKALLLKEIHHRVKNNLQIISSILSIQSRKLEDGNAKNAVEEGRSRIKSMSLIHEKLYNNNQLSIIKMQDYMEELSDFLFKTYKPAGEVEKHIESGDITLDIDTAIPVGLILNELISNSLKYAFKENGHGKLNISLSKDDQYYWLKVADTGFGFPDNFEELKSMGMRLVRSLTEQIGGILEVTNQNGTSFTIKFKPVMAA